jgi:hypothetical protein
MPGTVTLIFMKKPFGKVIFKFFFWPSLIISIVLSLLLTLILNIIL